MFLHALYVIYFNIALWIWRLTEQMYGIFFFFFYYDPFVCVFISFILLCLDRFIYIFSFITNVVRIPLEMMSELFVYGICIWYPVSGWISFFECLIWMLNKVFAECRHSEMDPLIEWSVLWMIFALNFITTISQFSFSSFYAFRTFCIINKIFLNRSSSYNDNSF